jgi:hypothetical protein
MSTKKSLPRNSESVNDHEERAPFTIDNFPVKLRKDCLKVARNRDMTLTLFTERWMRFGLEKERRILEAESRGPKKE